ncbi:SUMO-specific isopeptidase USPL1 isoform X2 [Rhineura floridana]|uniref:SUMO-specific isopeptidase USPL1 isoform X2 n=2 Tax=Rhineura floridana TaxID=261503 RepID=UPI002AC84AB1|nr:SUMO-specific isopeptidase USPL1 isoform X2 [Rhineura floridana]
MMDYQKIGNGLQVTGIGASALHMDCNSAEVTPEECCPACKKKGLVQALRIYRISFKESIFLCENPQCIYPLGFKPLNNIIIPINSQGTCRKRKVFDTSLVTSPVEQCLKLTRTDNLMDTEKMFKPDLASKCNGDSLFGTRSGQPDFSDSNSATESMEQKMDMEKAVQESSPEIFNVQAQLLSESEIGSSVSKILHQDKQSLPEPLWLQWRNTYALCWLDCILTTLVHLETLKMILNGSVLKNVSVIQSLFAKYNQATALVNTCQKGERVPLDVLWRAESHLNEIRNTIFVQLQPQLKCTLGKEESPVFAFPLLLQNDPQIEKLFLHSYSWKFECLQCGHQVSESYRKTLTTFTNIIPEWHPLNAVHIAPCNNCHHTSQRRKMVVENVSSVLMMHFVEGLRHNDLKTYSFHFKEDTYQITAVVQYQEEAKHFITWILNSDETWLECDDLKGSYSRRHKNFGVPPSEVHIVIWERKSNDLDLQLQRGGATYVSLLKKAQPDSPVKHVDDKAVDVAPLICHSEDMLKAQTNETQKLVSNDKSNLLWGLENLADDDVITLTLVSVPLDLKGKPLEDSHVVENNLMVKTDTLQLQDPGEVSVPPSTSERDIAEKEWTLPENTNAPLYQGQQNNASNTFIMPVVSLSNSNYSPETSVQGAEPEAPVKDSSRLDAANPQNKNIRTKVGSSVLTTPNIVEHPREATANSQVCAPSTSSNSSQSLPKNGRKSFVGSWVKGLLEKYPIIPKSVSTYNAIEISKKSSKKETNSSSLGRQASHFRGFQVKHSNKQSKTITERAFGSSHEALLPSAPTTSLIANPSIEKHHIGESKGTVAKSAGSLVTSHSQIQPKQSHNENKSFTSVENVDESSVVRAHQLRLQLLQQLKAKKEKLASLDRLAKAQVRNRHSPKKRMKDQSQLGFQKESESLQSLLNALQHQIDVEDGKSENSPSTSMSQCSSSSYDDILSELLSPATSVASLQLPQEEECRYLEIGGSPVPNKTYDGTQDTNHDHNYSPLKENGYEGHTDLSAFKSPLKKLNFDSPTKQDILEELLPSSMLNSIMADTEDLHHFDETLLTW